MDFTWLIFVAFAAGAAVGAVLLRLGLKGFATDDHPLCRACGFDLFGLPPNVTHCSECGADVTSPSATRIGHRRRRPRLILTGVGLLVPLLLTSLIWVAGAVGHVQWIHYQPLWYLRRQALATTVMTDPAGAEILRRIQASQLSDAQLQSLVDQVLNLQADPKQPWNTQWGDWVESVRTNKKLPDEKWKSYLANAVVVNLVARSDIQRGQGLPLRTETLPGRVGPNRRFWMETTKEFPKDSVVETRISGSFGNGSSLSASGGGWSSQTIPLDAKRMAAAKDGRQTLKVRMKVKIFDSPMPTRAVPPDATRDIDFDIPWTLLPADEPTVKPIHDPSLRPAVEKAIRDVRLQMSNNFQQDYVNVNAFFENAPVALAYKIILREGEQEWPAGSMSVLGKKSMGWGTGGQAEGLSADRVDVIFRPDERVAADTVDLHEYWDGEVVVKDVAIERTNLSGTAMRIAPASSPAR